MTVWNWLGCSEDWIGGGWEDTTQVWQLFTWVLSFTVKISNSGSLGCSSDRCIHQLWGASVGLSSSEAQYQLALLLNHMK